MENDDLIETIKYAHSIGKKVYVTINIFAWDEKYEEIIEMAKTLDEIKPDAVIVADGGVMEIMKQYAPNVKIHVKYTSKYSEAYMQRNFWYKNGAKRMILAREINKEQIKIYNGKQTRRYGSRNVYTWSNMFFHTQEDVF